MDQQMGFQVQCRYPTGNQSINQAAALTINLAYFPVRIPRSFPEITHLLEAH
jgi:hypothetical protein